MNGPLALARHARRRPFRGLARLAALAALAAPALLTAPVASGGGDAGTATGLVIRGRGFGHGVGLSQWGAEERARAGQSYRQILSFYYPGSRLASVAGASVRVLLAEERRLQVGSSSAFEVRDGRGRVLRLPPGLYPVTATGRLGSRVLALPLELRPGTEPLKLGDARYRGALRLRREGGRLQAINTLDLEDYLVGVVSSECPGYWPQEALRAQAVASRSYALASLNPRAAFDLFPDDRSQNYRGLEREFASAEAAVAATQGQALLYDGRPITAFFSASNGGLTSGTEDVWGGPPLPYLVSRADEYDASSPVGEWGPVAVSIDALRAAFPALPAAVVSIDVVRTNAQRVRTVSFRGVDGSTHEVAGPTFQARLGLRSTYFTVAPTYPQARG